MCEQMPPEIRDAYIGQDLLMKRLKTGRMGIPRSAWLEEEKTNNTDPLLVTEEEKERFRMQAAMAFYTNGWAFRSIEDPAVRWLDWVQAQRKQDPQNVATSSVCSNTKEKHQMSFCLWESIKCRMENTLVEVMNGVFPNWGIMMVNTGQWSGGETLASTMRCIAGASNTSPFGAFLSVPTDREDKPRNSSLPEAESRRTATYVIQPTAWRVNTPS
ncbi:hypothetical protein PI125_g8881 [Phytophthora idaei]|nr:hypothetical protein PI125_g8881 [Phytophthora idaei]KAG3132631.1 hypothetical protein PI126_g19557 [Phytophthora idaei]